MKRRIFASLAGVALLTSVFTVPAITSAKVTPDRSTNVTVIGYSTPGPVYINETEPAFQNTSAGKGVTFTNSFGASDAQANNVVNGQHADVVNFSYQPNMSLLEAHHLVPGNWGSKANHGGFVTESVGGLRSSRPGNPKHIHTWSDLLKKGGGRRYARYGSLGECQVEYSGRLLCHLSDRQWKGGQEECEGAFVSEVAVQEHRRRAVERFQRSGEVFVGNR